VDQASTYSGGDAGRGVVYAVDAGQEGDAQSQQRHTLVHQQLLVVLLPYTPAQAIRGT